MKSLQAFLTLVCLAVFTVTAQADVVHGDLILILSSGSDTQVVIDDAPITSTSIGGFTSSTVDTLSGEGLIGFAGSVGDFFVNVSTGLSNPVIGPNTLELTNVSISGAAGDLTIQLIDTGFSITTPGPQRLISNFGGTSEGTVNAVGGILDSNLETGFGPDTTHDSSGASVFASTETAGVALSGLFSLSSTVTITHTEGGTTGFNHQLSVVAIPEPNSCGLLLLGTLMAGLGRRR